MHSVQTGLWDPRPPSKHASPLPTPPSSTSRTAHVTTAAPAKRITFFKSGDSQFGGVRMAIHKRSFKCFDALLDDLSQKVPLPFGVRTVTTPRGTHTIKHLEQLQDGGCYLCSDRRQAKPINMELVNKRPNIWHHHERRPQPPEASPATPPGHSHLPYRQRRILLVKNSEPGMRRSVVLSRRSTRSLRAFLDEVSEVMQFHVRKLFTIEGRRIDSVQSLMTCPGVLVCVGREAFRPLLINFIRKSSEEKLPGLCSRSPALGPRTPGNGARSPATQGVRSPPHGAHSRASEYSEGHESKKNVNFGLETKKSIIHPRSDSSNRSSRFSLSSEKSYSNGVSACTQAKPTITNDDIEKRVLVNKDGSLSVEMRVRFRLQHDETIQWSTQIKKSPSLTNESGPLSQAQPHYLQQSHSESCSDPDSTSLDPEGVDYSSQRLQCTLEENRCQCCYQRCEQQFDLWENPAHIPQKPPVPPPHTSSYSHTRMRHTHSSSSSSSCNSRRVVRCRARLSSCGAGSGSEQSHVVQEEMCVTEQVEHRLEVEQDGGSHVEVHKVSQCCSRSEVVAVESNLRPPSRKSVEGELTMEDERPLSAVSSSSHILQSLKEDQDDEEDDLPPSVSQCGSSKEPALSPTSEPHLNGRPTSNISDKSTHSTQHKKEKDSEDHGSRAVSAASSCHCGAATPHFAAGEGDTDRAPSTMSKKSKASIQRLEEQGAADENKEITRVASGLSGHTGVSTSSQKSGTSSVCPNCGGCKRGADWDSMSRASQQSTRSKVTSPNPASPLPKQEKANNGSDDSTSDDSAVSTQSNKTNLTNHGCLSAMSNVLEDKAENGKEEERPPSSTSETSHRSNRSHNSDSNAVTAVEAENEEGRSQSVMSAKSNLSSNSTKSKCMTGHPGICSTQELEKENTIERADSSLSEKSGLSAKTGASVKSHKANCQSGTKDASPKESIVLEENDTNKRAPSNLSVKSNISAMSGKFERPDSVQSAKSNVSAKSKTSYRSACSKCGKAVSADTKAKDKTIVEVTRKSEEKETEERTVSAMSAKSNPDKSNKSHKSTKASERSLSPRIKTEKDREERAKSQMSDTSDKSNKSVKSSKSTKSKCEDNEMTELSSSRLDETEGNKMKEMETQQRPDSIMSAKSENNQKATSACSSKSHRCNCSENARATPTLGDSTGDCETAEGWTASALSSKSASSSKSNHTKTEIDDMMNRASSAKSTESKHNAASPDVKDDDENQERVASAMSIKSKSSAKSSRKSNVSPKVVTIKAPDGVYIEENGTKERAPSIGSQKSNQNGTVGVAVIQTVDSSENLDDDSTPRNRSSEHTHGQTLSPKRAHSPNAQAAAFRRSPSPGQQPPSGVCFGETRGTSALSIRSSVSSKSGRSKCHCRAALALEKAKKECGREDKEVEKNKEGEEATAEGTSGQEFGALPSSTKTQRRDSVEQPLSHNSTASVSFGLPEDQETDSDSGKSSVSAHGHADVAGCGKDFSVRESQSSSSNCRKSSSSNNLTAAHVPTVETSAESAEQKAERTTSAISLKSNKSCKSSCNCKLKEIESESTRSATTKKASIVDTPSERTTSTVSSASTKVRSKSPVSTKSNNMAKTTPRESPNDFKNQDTASKAKNVHQQSPKVKSHTGSDNGVKATSSQKKESPSKSSSQCPLHNHVESLSDSTLSRSLSAADLLKETMAAARTHSRQSKASKTSGKSKSEKSGTHQRSRSRKGQAEELTPTCLPSTSASEVVSDWLKTIPPISSMLPLGHELNEEDDSQRTNDVEEIPAQEVAKMEESPEDKVVSEVEEENEEDTKIDATQEKNFDPAPGETEGMTSHPSALPKNWQSSAAVMKILLSSSFGRCQSMPEVSPVYGRRLSTSARGLLDCLTQLQLIEPVVSPCCNQQKERNQQYDDIIAILQSLWLSESRTVEAKGEKVCSPPHISPPRSSSGVDMSSGSGGSGKETGNQGGDEMPPKESESLHGDETVEEVTEEEKIAESVNQVETSSEQDKEDTAEEPLHHKQETVPQSLDTPNASDSSDKSSGKDGSKSPTDNETQEDSGPSTPPTVVQAPLSKRLSQDPDPVWVLHLLKKLQKQFIDHYMNATAEFKVRWDLDDSVILDTMISELRDEVSRRIQSSIEREMKKIQGRAGRGGRLPRASRGGNLSTDSATADKRRQMLKIMKNQSVKTADSLSDGEMTGDFSDQRSEDEYCPCDACVRKKMAARPFKKNPEAAEAPVMMEFDLVKILLNKKNMPHDTATLSQPAIVESDSMAVDEEGRHLEVLQEEEEEDETKEDIKGVVVLEETIAEEEEQGKDEGDLRREVEEKGVEREEYGADDEEQEEEEIGVEESAEDETSRSAEEEVKEEDGTCQCQCARDEEDTEKEEEEVEESSNNTDNEEEEKSEGKTGEDETRGNEGEMGSGEDEETSYHNTVKEETTGQGETTENGKEEEEEEEEETTDRKSEEDETSNSAANFVANEESAHVEGNNSVSAEDGDNCDVSTGEEESSKDKKRDGSEEQEASAEEQTPSKSQGVTPAVCVTEGEEADAKDSDTDCKCQRGTIAEESAPKGARGNEEEDAVKESKIDENQQKNGALLHQFTRTSVESQPGSLEEIESDSPSNKVYSIEVPKRPKELTAGGGTGQRRSRSPGRVKQRKRNEGDYELSF
ncbi:uncharacterized protein rp1l1a [Pholidichthys leucotaenia]